MNISAEKFLNRLSKIDVLIANKSYECQRWKDISMSLGGFSATEKVSASVSPHGKSDAVCEYVDLEREIKTLKAERRKMMNTIERLPSVEYDLLYKIYVQDYSLKELAFHHKKSYDWVKKRKRNALKLLQELLNEA